MKTITLPLDEARAVFDAAVNLQYIGSGHLDDEEVEHLRSFAVRLGLDPMDITPYYYARKVPHPYRANGTERGCLHCLNRKGDKLHVTPLPEPSGVA